MEILLIILAILNIALVVFLIVLTAKTADTSSKKDISSIGKKLDMFDREMQNHSRMLTDQSAQMSRTIVSNISSLGEMLRSAQDSQLKQSSEMLQKIDADMKELDRGNRDTLEKLMNSNSQSMEKLRRENSESLEKINNTVSEKLQKTLDDRISRSFESVNKRLSEVYEGLGEMKAVASGVSDLKKVLSNVKTRGIMGEIQLGAILSEILSPEQYSEQTAVIPNSAEKVDFAVKLPGADDDGHVYLPIDSKFPGDKFVKLTEAYESGDMAELKLARASLEAEIKRSAKSIHDKYIKSPYTTDFAILFLPFESLYAEIVNMGLIEQLQRDYRINVAGPSTMAAMLNSLQMGFRTLAIQKKSSEVWTILEKAKAEFSKFEDVLESARNRLRQADKDLEALIGTRTNAINRTLKNVALIENENDDV